MTEGAAHSVPISVVAKIMGKSSMFVRIGLQRGLLPFGTAFKTDENHLQYDYYVSQKLLYEYTGYMYEPNEDDTQVPIVTTEKCSSELQKGAYINMSKTINYSIRTAKISGKVYYSVYDIANMLGIDSKTVLPNELVDNILSNYRYLSEMIPGITLKEPEEHSYRYRFPCEKSYYDSFGNKIATVSMKFINNSKKKLKCGIIEFNPNKCHENEHIIDEVRTILSLAESYHFESLDLAIDIPINRMLVHLLKDKRAQLIYKASKDCSTEYLGKKRNDSGHVKLYDKSEESGLSTPLTRIEITVGNPSLPDWGQKLYNNWLPKVTVFDPKSSISQDIQLNDTEKVLLELLQYNSEKVVYWHRLGRKEKAKLKPLVFADQKYLEYNFDAINQVVQGMVSLMDPYVISANSNSSINSSNGSSEA